MSPSPDDSASRTSGVESASGPSGVDRASRTSGRTDSGRRNISSGGPWEAVIGYSRAVRVGNVVAVSGTTSAEPDGSIFGAGDAALQARRCFEIIERALIEAGATLADVVRTRMFVTNIDDWEAIGRVHGEVFGAIRPAATMVQVARLIDPAILIEIEADAIIAEPG